MSSLELVLAISLLLFAGIAVDRSAALAELEAEQNAGFATPREFQMTDNYFRKLSNATSKLNTKFTELSIRTEI